MEPTQFLAPCRQPIFDWGEGDTKKDTGTQGHKERYTKVLFNSLSRLVRNFLLDTYLTLILPSLKNKTQRLIKKKEGKKLTAKLTMKT